MTTREKIFTTLFLTGCAALWCAETVAGRLHEGDTAQETLGAVTACLADSLLSSGKSTESHVVVTSDSDTINLEDILKEPSTRYYSLFQKAVTMLLTGQPDTAATMLQECIALDSTASEAYYYLSKYYDAKAMDSLSTAMKIRAAELQPENLTYKEALLPAFLNKGDIQGAIDVAEEIVTEDPERTEMLEILLQLYSHLKDNERCLHTLQRLETQEGPGENITITKVQIYSNMGKEKKALEELNNLVESNPLSADYRIMRGNWHLRQNNKEEALSDFNAVLSEEPDNENAVMSMMDYYRSEGKDSIADSFRDRLLMSTKTQQSTKLLILKQVIRSSEQQTTDSTAVLQLFDRILQTKQPDTDILELKIAYMQLKNMPEEEVRKALTLLLDENPGSAYARNQLILIAMRNQDYKEMIRLAKPALEYNPEERSFSLFLAIGYFFIDDNASCIATLQNGVLLVDEEREANIAAEMYSLLGDALYKIGKKKEAYQAYENCLRIDPEKTSCLNNYAYYLSEERQDLEKAAAMSLKTVKAEPDNSTYLDTYAWIMYCLQRYEEAKIYIDLAVKYLSDEEREDPENVILKHQKEIHRKTK